MPKREPLSTDKQIKQLKAEGKPYEHSIRDGHGLRIRVSPKFQTDPKTGERKVIPVKAWYYRYRSRIETVQEGKHKKEVGKLERVKLGNYPGMSLAKAREEVEYHRTIVKKEGSAKQYRDTNLREKAKAHKAAKEQEARDTYTVDRLIDDFVETISDPKRADAYIQSWSEYSRSLKKYVGLQVGDVSAHELSRNEVRNLVLAPLKGEGKVVLSNRVLAYLKRCYNWGIEESKVEVNPCLHIKRGEEGGGRRPLSHTEIKRMLVNLSKTDLPNWYADFLLMILLTGLRPSEAAEVRWDYIDSERRTLTLPQTKGGRIKKKQRSFVVPLSKQMMALLKRRENDSEWIFPSRADQRQPIQGDRMQAPLRDAISDLKVMPFTPACLRTTFTTEISGIEDKSGQKISRFLKERLLNHADASVTGQHYDMYEYLDEKRHWLDTWGTHIESLMPATKKRKAVA